MTREEKIEDCKRLLEVYTNCRNYEMSFIPKTNTEKLELYERNLDNLGSRIVRYKAILDALENNKDTISDFPLEDF